MGRHSRRKAHRIADFTTFQGLVDTVQCVCGSHDCRWAAYSTPFRWRGVGDEEWRRQSWGAKPRKARAR